MKELKEEDILENVVIIKINNSYFEGIPDLELYEATRGIWKRKIESVERAEYCLSVAFGEVKEVYEIEGWYPACTIKYETRVVEPVEGRIEFVGKKASDSIRNKYIGKSVKSIYKLGDGNPVRVILNKGIVDINTAISAEEVILDGSIKYRCPRCVYLFNKAERCPDCGQLIKL